MKKAFVLPLLFFLLLNYSEAAKQSSVQRLRFSSYSNYTRVVIDINGPVEYSQNRIPDPDRIYFDLKNCRLSRSAKSVFDINDGILQTVRMAQFNDLTVRVVLNVKSSDKYYAFMLENPHRIVIDVYAHSDAPGTRQEDNEQKVLTDKYVREIRTIVIDPGHGGEDPGAVGPHGLREKDIVLNVGKKLGDILRTKHGVDIVYTRDRDVFVPLNERTETANTRKADLFISIHTNASPKRNVRGVETYFLNWTDNNEALRVAARENKISIKKMQDMRGGLQMILQDLERNTKREESLKLAHSVQNSIVNNLQKDYRNIENLGVKYALFYVLVGAEMPSILVEISFISNREEEKRLADDRYKGRIAEAMAEGINSYISQSTLIVTPASRNMSEG